MDGTNEVKTNADVADRLDGVVMRDSKEVKVAISVKDGCADVYYDSFHKLPDGLRKKISMQMLHHIFKEMVVPAIDKARELDRGGRIDAAGNWAELMQIFMVDVRHNEHNVQAWACRDVNGDAIEDPIDCFAPLGEDGRAVVNAVIASVYGDEVPEENP